MALERNLDIVEAILIYLVFSFYLNFFFFNHGYVIGVYIYGMQEIF